MKKQWLQEQVSSGKIKFQKISCKKKTSETLTHHYTGEETKNTSSTWALIALPTSANLGETRDVIQEEAACASLMGSPPLGNDTHGNSMTKEGGREVANKKYGETSFFPILRSVEQRFFHHGWKARRL